MNASMKSLKAVVKFRKCTKIILKEGVRSATLYTKYVPLPFLAQFDKIGSQSHRIVSRLFSFIISKTHTQQKVT